MGKRVQTIKEIVFQGHTIPSGTVGEIESNGGQISHYLQGQSSSNGQEVIVIFDDSGDEVKVPFAMNVLELFIVDVPVNTPLTVIP